MALLTLLLSLLSFSAFADSPAAEVQPLNIEVGFGLGYSTGTGGLPPSSERALFAVMLGYHLPRWTFGITTRGAFSTKGDTKIYTSSVTESGSIVHRTIEYGLVARHYVNDQWYAQLAGGIGYNEAVSDGDDVKPDPSPYFNRFYLDGTWLQAAVGTEFKDSPWFLRLEYTYTFYYRSNIVGTEAGVNRSIEESDVLNRPREQIVTLVVGLANIF